MIRVTKWFLMIPGQVVGLHSDNVGIKLYCQQDVSNAAEIAVLHGGLHRIVFRLLRFSASKRNEKPAEYDELTRWWQSKNRRSARGRLDTDGFVCMCFPPVVA